MNFDQLIQNGDRLVAPSKFGSRVSKYKNPVRVDDAVPYGEGSSKQQMKKSSSVSEVMDDYFELPDEKQALRRKAECRFCQEEDFVQKMEAPCACKGTLEFAHRKCVQKWCNAKLGITCEICHQHYKPGYTYTAPQPSTPLPIVCPPYAFGDFSGGSRILLFSPGILQSGSIVEGEPLEEAQIEEELTLAKTCCNTFILMQIIFCFCNAMLLTALVVKHVHGGRHSDEELDTTGIFYLSMACMLPSYAIAFLLHFCRRGRPRPEETAPRNTETPEVAIVLDSGEQSGAGDQEQLQDEAVEPEQVVSETEVHPGVLSIGNIVTSERSHSQGNHLCQCRRQNSEEIAPESTENPTGMVSESEFRLLGSALKNIVSRERSPGSNFFQRRGQNPPEATSGNTGTPTEVVIEIDFGHQNEAADHLQIHHDDEAEVHPLLSKLRNTVARERSRGNN